MLLLDLNCTQILVNNNLIDHMVLKIGQVFKKKFPLPQLPGMDIEWNVINVRILMVDDQFVYYEQFSLGDKSGNFTKNLLNKIVYYRINTVIFLENSTYLGDFPFTNDEKILFRFDLPINLFQEGLNFKWSDIKFERLELFAEYLGEEFSILNRFKNINSNKMIIYPFGKRYGYGKPVTIESMNNSFFDPIELLWRLNNIQAASLNKEVFPFLGVFRLGHEKSLPTYAIQR